MNKDSIIADLLRGSPIDYTITAYLREQSGFDRVSAWAGQQLSGLATSAGSMAKFVVASFIAQWVLTSVANGMKNFKSPWFKKKQTDIISQSYEPMLREIFKVLGESLEQAQRRTARGEIVDVDTMLQREMPQIERIIVKHTDVVFQQLRQEITTTVIAMAKEDIESTLDKMSEHESLRSHASSGGVPIAHVHVNS